MKIAIVGAGLYGATVAHLLRHEEVHVFEKSPGVGGNVRSYYDEAVGCHVSVHGAHIFHTNSDRIWELVNKFAEFNSYRHYVKGLTSNGRIIDLPFGMSLFSQLLNINDPAEARLYFARLKRDLKPSHEPETLESWCLANIGPVLYREVVKNYTEKQWGRSCDQLPADIIRRLPLRFTYDNTYFNNAKYQGMPLGGYTDMVDRMFGPYAQFTFGTDIGHDELHLMHSEYDHIFFSGELDTLFDRCLGSLEYRGLKFTHVHDHGPHSLGAPVINDLSDASHTRQIEHRLFYPEAKQTGETLVTVETPLDWEPGQHPYYPVRNAITSELHAEYMRLAAAELPKVVVGGRLGAFRYYDMDQVIGMAMADVARLQ